MKLDPDRIKGDTIREIIREAESYLSAQLITGVASDQRAATLSGILATLATGMLGGGLAVITAEKANYPLGIAGIFAGVVMLIGLAFAIYTARPVPFHYVGNCPENWNTDEDLYGSLDHALWQQARHYQELIDENDATLKANARYLRRAGYFTLASPICGLTTGLSVWAGVAVEEVAVGAAVAVAVGAATSVVSAFLQTPQSHLRDP